MKNLKNVFISKSKEKFGDKFDYSKVNYIKYNIPIILICKEHGEFTITRLNKHKWTFEEAINTPKGSRRKK